MEEIPEQDSVPPLRVGLTYNLKKNIKSDIEDIEAEYDNIETVEAIKNAIESGGYSVELMEADEKLPARLKANKVDIVFNIAEGINGRGREAQVPAILNFYNIPFTGSDETTLCIALDKALTKRLLSTYHIATPKYRIITTENKTISANFAFPAIVKPNAEGSSKGISDVAIVTDKKGLIDLTAKNVSLYKQDMLVEEYIPGREFTVGVLGNGAETRVFSPMEIVYINKQNNFNIYSYNVKQNYKQLIRYECPASISKETKTNMMSIARKIFDILQCKDFARLDFRLSPENKPYFIEINPLPGLAPGYSDYPMLAGFNGMDYNALVLNILHSALKRHGIIPSH